MMYGGVAVCCIHGWEKKRKKKKKKISPTILHDFPYLNLHNLFLPCLAEMMWTAPEAWNAFKNTKHSSSQTIIHQHFISKGINWSGQAYFKILDNPW